MTLNPTPPRTTLVTGANGFIGRHVSRAASMRGDRVVGIGLGEWTEDSWHHWGLSAWSDFQVTVDSLAAIAGKPDIVIHCAGSASVGLSFDDPAQDFQSTVGTTIEVLEFLRTRAPEAALVYPSSGAVYGNATILPITEDSPLAPISPYGVHKRIAEELCRSYSQSFGIRTAILRIFSAYGTDLRKQLLWDACRKAMQGQSEFGGSGQETRDWVNVEDVARLMLIAAGHADAAAPTVNCATGQGVAIERILDVLFGALGTSLRPQFNRSVRLGDPERVAGDPTRARDWGWVPQVPWQDGIREYAAWFLEHGR
jgi:UDP-glucose 4-epimerase